MPVTRTTAALVLFSALISVPAFSAGLLNQQEAYGAAIAILKGDPYGNSDAQVRRNIERAQLITSGSACRGALKAPIWQFRILVPKARNPSGGTDIKGALAVDARTGKLVCAGVPFLD